VEEVAAGERAHLLLVEKVGADGAAGGGALHGADEFAEAVAGEGAELEGGEDELRVAEEEEHGEGRGLVAGAADGLDALEGEEGGGVFARAQRVEERERVVARGVRGGGVGLREDDAVLDPVKV